MHELGIATRIVEIVKQAAADNSADRVATVTVEIGRLSGVDSESLEFSFAALTKGTELEGARLIVEEERPRAKCRQCGGEYEVDLSDFRCRACGSSSFDVISGMDVYVKQVEVESGEEGRS